MNAGFAYARSQNPERSTDRDVNAMTGSAQHTMERRVEVSAVMHSSHSVTCECQDPTSGWMFHQKRRYL